MSTARIEDLIQQLQQLVVVYRTLFCVVRSEHNALIQADVGALSALNETKTKLIVRIKKMEVEWSTIAKEMCPEVETGSTPRLVTLALRLEGEKRVHLLRLRKVLNMLIEKTHAMNKENEVLIQSALAHVSGAMNAIREDIVKDSVYQKKGKKNESSEKLSGRLMSKEA
ncbi:MAG: flagellar protein FlgN [Bdellovibrionaceae bacterium]|nr:flagellar protein FlgN [Pseudobdellovibrionaceae bacterium]